MNWFTNLLPSRIRISGNSKKGVPEGLWSKCNKCTAITYGVDLESNLYVCPKCGYHSLISARKRLELFLDSDAKCKEIGASVKPVDRLKFRDSKKYKDRLTAAEKTTGENEALIVLKGKLSGQDIVAAAFEYKFVGGSMGAAVGERFVQAVNASIANKCPLICFTATGGARMQEGIISLMQMAKVSAALVRLASFGIPFISVHTYPTMGGVSASLAMLGDIIIAEPGCLSGFAGPRVIEQIVREKLPQGFQDSEFLLNHGAIDMVVDRRDMRDTVARLLAKITFSTSCYEKAQG